tara:strand:- start:312 stop:1784 length:1473 start_codon:yes stop_codon:yes gene_type:complete
MENTTENVIESLIENIIDSAIERSNNIAENNDNIMVSPIHEKTIEKEKIIEIDGILILGGDNEKQVWKQSNKFFILNKNFQKNSLCEMICGKCLFAIEKYCHYLFIFGGFDGNRCTNDICRYDFITNKWDTIGNLVEKRTGCFSVLDEKNHKIYIIGGTQSKQLVSVIEEYDIITGISNSFIKTDLPRSCGGAILYNEKIYMFGGSKHKKDFFLEILDIKKKSFEFKENIILNNSGIAYCFSFMDNLPCIFIVCGENFTKDNKKKIKNYFNDFYYYDIDNNTLNVLPSPKHCRTYCSLVVYENNLHLIGGYDGNNVVSDIEIFSLDTKTWTIKSTNHIEKCGSGIICVQNEIFNIKGNIVNNKPEGFCEIFLNNQLISKGNYKDGKKEGKFEELNITRYYENGIVIPSVLFYLKKKLLKVEIPLHFLCPISKEIMLEPVTTSSGFTYERKNIIKWMDNKKTDPLTREKIDYKLYNNFILKTIIKEYIENL